MDRIFANKSHRAIFFIAFAAVMIIDLLLRYYLIPENSLAARVAEGFFTSSAVAFLVGLFLYIGTSNLRDAHENLEILTSDSIKRRFSTEHGASRSWYFKGGLGRYFTSEALRQVLSNGRSGYQLKAYIVNPFDGNLCAYVAQHRKGKNTSTEIRRETLVTLIEYVRRVQSDLPNIAEAHCGLIDDFAPLRVDLCDRGVFITHDNPSAPAIFHREGSLFFEAIRQELTTGPNSYKTLDIRSIAEALTARIAAPSDLSHPLISNPNERANTSLS